MFNSKFIQQKLVSQNSTNLRTYKPNKIICTLKTVYRHNIIISAILNTKPGKMYKNIEGRGFMCTFDLKYFIL